MHLMYQLRKFAQGAYTFLLFLGRFLVLLAIVAAPWKNGGADLEYQRFFLWLALGSGICAFGTLAFASQERRKETNLRSVLLVALPLFLGLAVCVFQITPLSEQTLAKVSPYVLKVKEYLTPSIVEGGAEASTDVSEDTKNAEQLARFNEAVFPLTEDSNFNVDDALALENSEESKLLKDGFPTWGNTISVYPLATREWLPLFWGGFLFFFSTAVLFNSKRSRNLLFVVAAVVGLSYALACLAFKANPSVREWSLFSSLIRREDDFRLGFGTYVNKNNCGGYLVYCLTACIFLASWAFLKSAKFVTEERRRRKEENEEINAFYEIRKDENWKVLLGDFFDLFNRRVVCSLCFVVLILATIAVSMSRGAATAALASSVCAFVLLSVKKENRRYWIIFLIVFLAVAGVVEAVGLTQRVHDRMATIVTEDLDGETALDRDARLDNWRGARETAANYYWFGAGLGNYALVNGANDVATKEGKIFYYAENSFIQTMVELGLVGCVLFIIEYALLFLCFARLIWKSRSAEGYALGVGGIALTVGQLLTSLGDFGVYLSGNLVTLAVLYGAFLSYRRSEAHKSEGVESNRRFSSQSRRRALTKSQNVDRGVTCAYGSVLLIVLLGGTWTLPENKDYISRHSLLKETRFTDEQYVHLSDDSLDALISNFESYIRYRDDSAEIRNRAAELELSRYRLRLLDFLKEQRPDDNVEDLWKETAITNRLRTLLGYQARGFDVAVDSLRDNRFARESILPAVLHATTSRRICPMLPQTYVYLSETAPLANNLSFEQNRVLIELYARRALLFGKYDSDALYAFGFFTGVAGLKSLQNQFWHRTLEFSRRHLQSVLLLLAIDTTTGKLDETIAEVLPEDPAVLANAPNVLNKEFKNSLLYAAIVKKGSSYFENQPEDKKDSEYYYYSGLFFIGKGDYERADEDLQKAFEKDSMNYSAFFRRIELLCSRSKELRKEEECVKLLKEFSVGKEGAVRARCESLLERAEKILSDKNAYETAKRRNQDEKDSDERIKNSRSSSDSTEDEEVDSKERTVDKT